MTFVFIWWRIDFFDTDENEYGYYFPFILFVSYVIFIITYVRGLLPLLVSGCSDRLRLRLGYDISFDWPSA